MSVDLNDVQGLPTDSDGPVFRAPWEAAAFAMAVKLSQDGHFTWKEWVDFLAAEIAASENQPHDGHDDEHDDSDAHDHEPPSYYELWLAALEKVIFQKQLLNVQVVDARQQYLRDNPVPHDHIAKREPVCIA